MLLLVTSALADISLCLPGRIGAAWPPAEAVDVPVNAQPWVALTGCAETSATVSVTLSGADGTVLAEASTTTDVRPSWTVLPLPGATLEPETTYTGLASGDWTTNGSWAFTTGTELATPGEVGPDIRFEQAELAFDGASLDGLAGFSTFPEEALAVELVLGDGTPVFGGAVEFLSTESLWLPMPAGAAGDEVCLHGRSLDATGHWAEGPESCVEIEPHPICGLRGDPAVGAAAFALAAAFVARRRSRGR